MPPRRGWCNELFPVPSSVHLQFTRMQGLDEESLALFDILRKPDLDKNAIAQLKQVAGSLLETLKAEKL